MPLHHTFMQMIIVSAIKEEKYFIYVNTLSNNLNFALKKFFLVNYFTVVHDTRDAISQAVNFNYFL